MSPNHKFITYCDRIDGNKHIIAAVSDGKIFFELNDNHNSSFLLANDELYILHGTNHILADIIDLTTNKIKRQIKLPQLSGYEILGLCENQIMAVTSNYNNKYTKSIDFSFCNKMLVSGGTCSITNLKFERLV